MFEKKKKMTLQEYLNESHRPENRFTEDEDHIIFHSGPESLRVVIDKNTYYASTNADDKHPNRLTHTQKTKYFDMLAVNYKVPHIPNNAETKMMFGQYYLAPEGPSFYLTEPRNATHLLIYDLPKYPDYYRLDNITKPHYDSQGYFDANCQVILRESIYDWVSNLIYIAKPAEWEKEHFLKKCQVNFFGQLDNFYCQA